MSELPEIERLQALHIEPDDIIVANAPTGSRLTNDDIEQLQKALVEALCHKHVIVLEGLDIEVYRRVRAAGG